MDKLSHIFVQYDDVLPFSRVKEAHLDCPSTGWMEELARELISLARGDETCLGLPQVLPVSFSVTAGD
jgi:hypothetical protein